MLRFMPAIALALAASNAVAGGCAPPLCYDFREPVRGCFAPTCYDFSEPVPGCFAPTCYDFSGESTDRIKNQPGQGGSGGPIQVIRYGLKGEWTPPETSAPYANCSAAAAAGVHNIRRGDPRYGTHLDADNDGFGCDQK
jgi:hypothetical protein